MQATAASASSSVGHSGGSPAVAGYSPHVDVRKTSASLVQLVQEEKARRLLGYHPPQPPPSPPPPPPPPLQRINIPSDVVVQPRVYEMEVREHEAFLDALDSVFAPTEEGRRADAAYAAHKRKQLRQHREAHAAWESNVYQPICKSIEAQIAHRSSVAIHESLSRGGGGGGSRDLWQSSLAVGTSVGTPIRFPSPAATRRSAAMETGVLGATGGGRGAAGGAGVDAGVTAGGATAGGASMRASSLSASISRAFAAEDDATRGTFRSTAKLRSTIPPSLWKSAAERVLLYSRVSRAPLHEWRSQVVMDHFSHVAPHEAAAATDAEFPRGKRTAPAASTSRVRLS